MLGGIASRRRRGRQRTRWLVGITDSMNVSLGELWGDAGLLEPPERHQGSSYVLLLLLLSCFSRVRLCVTP